MSRYKIITHCCHSNKYTLKWKLLFTVGEGKTAVIDRGHIKRSAFAHLIKDSIKEKIVPHCAPHSEILVVFNPLFFKSFWEE